MTINAIFGLKNQLYIQVLLLGLYLIANFIIDTLLASMALVLMKSAKN